MLTRRFALAAPLILLPAVGLAQDRFAAFLAGVRADAIRAGLRPASVDAALSGLRPNPKVLDLLRHQPEFSLTWAQYKARVLPQSRLDAARKAYAENATLLARVIAAYPADAGVVMGIWGIESGFGAKTGTYGVVESLATLAYAGSRASYFRSELIAALRILDHGDIGPRTMTGSWAGAMGQPQFMPSSYLHYAVDADGDGKRDIWTNRADVFGSIANYLVKSGWRAGEPWGQKITVPPGFTAAGRDTRKPLGAWQAMGVRRIDGNNFTRSDVLGAVVMPDGAGGEAFMVYANFAAIRRYNPSDFYALAVGLLGNAVA